MENQNPPPFEIGLVMAGAVSAGAYTAGVMDYLLEVLETWQKEKEKEKGKGNSKDLAQSMMFRRASAPPPAVFSKC